MGSIQDYSTRFIAKLGFQIGLKTSQRHAMSKGVISAIARYVLCRPEYNPNRALHEFLWKWQMSEYHYGDYGGMVYAKTENKYLKMKVVVDRAACVCMNKKL